MNLYLVQHGEAASKDVDPERPLTVSGCADVERVGSMIERAGLDLGRLGHSGKLRTTQTADILARALGFGGAIETFSDMAPNDSTEPWLTRIAQWSENSMLVGHMPFMGCLAARLITANVGEEWVEFQPGSVLCLRRRDRGRWLLAWFVRPELLRGDSVYRDPNSRRYA